MILECGWCESRSVSGVCRGLVDDSYVTIGLDGSAAPFDGNYMDVLA